jgi:cytochrome c oxidase subunit 2
MSWTYVYKFFSVLCLLLSCWSAQASEQLYLDRCLSCHGGTGAGTEALGAPSIAGMSSKYVALQLRHYRDGIRGYQSGDSFGPLMVASAKGLSDENIAALAVVVSEMAVPKLMLSAEGDAFNPFKARGVYSGCSSCHGAKGDGNEALGAPRISQQYPSYLKRQLLNFRAGVRGDHKDDVLGQQMKLLATQIPSEDDIDTITRYLVVMGAQ